MTAAPRFADWFRYFPDDYRWSAALALVLGTAPYGGAELGEVDRVGRRLRERVGDDDAWFREWTALGDEVFNQGVRAESSSHPATAAGLHLRATSYYQIGERFRTPKDEGALAAYQSSLESFRRFAALSDRAMLESVEVPYGDTNLPAWLVHPLGREGKAVPCVVFFDGLDITKELQYLRGVDELVRRGVACLLVDGPGNGESIRLRGLTLCPDYERAGSAALDHLQQRSDIDSERIAVMAISLGGYYAARCASLEPRFAACVAWGAIWDYHATWERRVRASFQTALSVPGHHIAWVLGVDTVEEALDRLRDYRLDGVVQQMRAPFLLLHGAEDEQVPLADARALYEAVGAKDKTLRVFTAREGGATHCQNDQLTSAVTEICDWLEDHLHPARV